MRGATAGPVSGDGLTLTNVLKPLQASELHSRMHILALDSGCRREESANHARWSNIWLDLLNVGNAVVVCVCVTTYGVLS